MVLVQQSDDSLCLSDCKLLLLEDGVRQDCSETLEARRR